VRRDSRVMDPRYDGAVVPRGKRSRLPRPTFGRIAALLLPVALLVGMSALREGRSDLVERHYSFAPSADTYVSSALPEEPFGAQPVVRVVDADDKALRAFLRFDLRGVTGQVLRATLSLYPLSSSESGVVVSQVGPHPWDERKLTFARSPGVGAVLANSGPVVAERWTRVDVTAAVKGDGPLTLALTALHPPSTAYASRETAMAPTLDVRVRVPAGDAPAAASPAGGAAAAAPAPASGDPVVVAAGNIACDPAEKPLGDELREASGPICQARATADLAASLRPSAVLALGDLQYDDGTLEKFKTSYGLTWGRLRQITHPVPGHKEYLDAMSGRPAGGYFAYFKSAAGRPGRGWYSFDIGRWHVVALNSECDEVGGCTGRSPQLRWLRADLAANRHRCTLAYWNRPRFSSGQHGGQTTLAAFWHELYAGRVDVVLNGRAYDYERFAPQDPLGRRDAARGIRQFVVGTGGRHLEQFEKVQRNSEQRSAASYGVLQLTLRPDRYEWRFLPTTPDGFTDAGAARCH
jgi:acid phosphatase type 7